MNAGGVAKACKSNAVLCFARNIVLSGKRERNTLVTYLELVNNPGKLGLIRDMMKSR